MRKALIAVACVVCFAGVARGQASVAGDWTGGISINGGVLHLAIHIAKTDDGYQGTLDSID